MHALNKIVKKKKITQEELGNLLGQDQSLISKKLKGKARWQPDDLAGLEKIVQGEIKKDVLLGLIFLGSPNA